MAKRRLLFAGAAAVMLAAPSAFAHAPPEGSAIEWVTSGGKETAVVRTNRGFIFASDESDGVKFRMLCPEAFGASLVETVPFAFTSEGKMLLGTYQNGLVAASGDVCSFDTVPGPLANNNMLSLEPLAMTPRGFVAVTAANDHVYTTTDDGKTWAAPSAMQDFVFGLRVAPADDQRLYATALHAGDSGIGVYQLLTSPDRGKTYHATTVPLTDTETRLDVAGVDATDPKRAYLRVVSADPETPERLLRTDDAGATVALAIAAPGPLTLKSVAGGATWLGAFDALYRSNDQGKTFAPVPAAAMSRIGCIEHHDGKLYVCGLYQNEFGVRVSSDDGATFSWFLRFPDVKDQVACPTSSQAITACAQLWHDWQVEQGQIPGSGGTGGSGGALGTGGVATTSGGAPATGGAPSSGGGAPSRSKSDGGCQAGSGDGSRTGGALTALVLFFAARRRRRSQPSTSAIV